MSREQYPSRARDQFPLRVDEKGPLNIRFPAGLRDRIKEAAKANNRSMNAELVHRLEQSFETPRSVAPAIAELLDRYVEDEVAARLHAIAAKIGGAS